MALPIITLFIPILMSTLVCWFYEDLLFRWKITVYVMTVIVAESIRAFFYIIIGEGFYYLLRDGETQLISTVLILEQLLLGVIIIGILTILRKAKGQKGIGGAHPIQAARIK